MAKPGNMDFRTVRLSCDQLFSLNSAIFQMPGSWLTSLHLHGGSEEAYARCMLQALQIIVSHTSSLHTLGISNLHVTETVVFQFERLVHCLPASMRQLHLCTSYIRDQRYWRSQERFVSAISQINTLEELHELGWETLMAHGYDQIFAVSLSKLPKLKIMVPSEAHVKYSILPPLSIHKM